MPPLLKKKPDKGKALTPAWHTNFRNYAVLPDTKLVRTSFFASFAFVTLAAAALIAVVLQETRIRYLDREFIESGAQIERMRGPSSQAIAQFRKFQEEERKINEVSGFVKGQKLVFSDLLIHLSRTLPASVALANVEYRETGASIRGYVQGASEQAAGNASDYERLLKEDAELKKTFTSIALTNLVRDQQTNKHLFEIALSFESVRKK